MTNEVISNPNRGQPKKILSSTGEALSNEPNHIRMELEGEKLTGKIVNPSDFMANVPKKINSKVPPVFEHSVASSKVPELQELEEIIEEMEGEPEPVEIAESAPSLMDIEAGDYALLFGDKVIATGPEVEELTEVMESRIMDSNSIGVSDFKIFHRLSVKVGLIAK